MYVMTLDVNHVLSIPASILASMAVPPRLSDQQKFILAYLAEQGSPSWPTTRVSWAVAREFEGRVTDRKENMADGGASPALAGIIMRSLEKQEVLTPEHRSSFSRAVSRLEDRGLIWKRRRTVEREYLEADLTRVKESRESEQSVRLGLTEEGEAAADAILQRVGDGRYALSFETL